MLRWCAYCQTSLGERAPFEDPSVTHTICAVCFDHVRRQCERDLAAQAAPLEELGEEAAPEFCKLGA